MKIYAICDKHTVSSMQSKLAIYFADHVEGSALKNLESQSQKSVV